MSSQVESYAGCIIIFLSAIFMGISLILVLLSIATEPKLRQSSALIFAWTSLPDSIIIAFSTAQLSYYAPHIMPFWSNEKLIIASKYIMWTSMGVKQWIIALASVHFYLVVMENRRYLYRKRYSSICIVVSVLANIVFSFISFTHSVPAKSDSFTNNNTTELVPAANGNLLDQKQEKQTNNDSRNLWFEVQVSDLEKAGSEIYIIFALFLPVVIQLSVFLLSYKTVKKHQRIISTMSQQPRSRDTIRRQIKQHKSLMHFMPVFTVPVILYSIAMKIDVISGSHLLITSSLIVLICFTGQLFLWSHKGFRYVCKSRYFLINNDR